MMNGLCRITLAPTVPCATGSETLCLGSGRFRVELTWRGKIESERGTGQAVPISDDTGYFWFFDAANVELVLKVLDGTAINDAFWVFYGALSDLEYVITVTDGVTGAIQSYISYAGSTLRGQSNSGATRPPFPDRARLGGGDRRPRRRRPRPRRPARAFRIPPRSAWRTAASRCASTGSRARSARPRARRPCSLTGDTGYFWFFDDSNVELVVKVLDGTAINGHYWVFYGSLSNVQFEVIVTDTQTGRRRRT